VSIGGARTDLVNGLDEHTREWLSNADVWVTTGGHDLMTNSFPLPRAVDALRATPGIDDVRVQRGGFLDVDDRRLWLLGRPRDDRVMIPSSQLVDGDLDQATARLRRGGWATVAEGLAVERHLAIGDPLSLPAPTGTAHYRVAAITMNMGWIPGAVTVNAQDYAATMGTRQPSALEVDLTEGVTPREGVRLVRQALASGSGLTVQTRAQRELQYYDFGRQGVARLNQIAVLLLIAAALAVAGALVATVLQRRPRLAAMKIQGAKRGQLWQALLVEAALLVTVGCAVGSVLGILGHLLAGRYLRLTTGFASPFSLGLEQLVLATGVVAGIALLVSAIPGFLAANTPIRASYQE
jgi:putative ABC transport system permease protein